MARPNSPFGPDVELIMDLSRPDVLPMTLHMGSCRRNCIPYQHSHDLTVNAVTARHA